MMCKKVNVYIFWLGLVLLLLGELVILQTRWLCLAGCCLLVIGFLAVRDVLMEYAQERERVLSRYEDKRACLDCWNFATRKMGEWVSAILKQPGKRICLTLRLEAGGQKQGKMSYLAYYV
jgi:hypothetical protein